jgi:hypothetical protein
MPLRNRALSTLAAEISNTLERLERGSTAPPDPVPWAEDRLGFQLDPWQRRVLSDDHHRHLILCPRQAGKSTIVAAKTALLLVSRPGIQVVALAPSIRQSSMLAAKTADVLHGEDVVTETATRLVLANGSQMLALPGDQPKTVRGATADVVLLDEASRIRDELVVAALPMTAATNGAIVMLSTPAGAAGAFYDAWVSDELEWTRTLVTLADVAHYSENTIRTMKRRLGERMFSQEFENRFLEAPGALFSAADIDALFARSPNPAEYTSVVPAAAGAAKQWEPLF